jgi:hypothetical protein
VREARLPDLAGKGHPKKEPVARRA